MLKENNQESELQ